MKKHYFFFLFIFGAAQSIAQTIKVQPYLQDAEPNSIYILWETDNNDESIVEWGLTNSLGNSTLGTSDISNGTSRIHEVKLENLLDFTKYFYRVKTGSAVSQIFAFKTSPLASSNEPIRIVAMSDMQQDASHPNKFNEIIQDGVIDYLNDEFGGDIIDNLALIMIPGDLVDNGIIYSEWEETFFTPAEELFSQVPVYPVLGNHEYNSTYYFKYFKMPENGTPGYEEHWWYKDYGNTRIIGLDSNNPFSNQQQLDWLEALLDSTCVNDDIDFVFAQLHHPHKSELWTPGESNYTGDVIKILEEFTTSCNKPSIHFFGHTHAYSRGNSRDHKHLWVNAASAGGAIDNWGEFPNADYDEFSVSQDDYGFVSVEITSDSDPKVVVKRISRGDQDVIIDNVETDQVIIRLNPTIVNTPTGISPVNVEVAPECVLLKADSFLSPNFSSLHGQSHWQVSSSSTNFSAPVAESWKTYQNWYYEVNTQSNDDLADEKIEGLLENATFWWRVRYRDRELNWSEWSTPVTFSTGESISLPNLITNPGAENDLNGWTVTLGIAEALTDGECTGTTPNTGNKYFAVGGLCNESDTGILQQNIDVSSYALNIDSGNLPVNFGGYLSDYGGQDVPEMKLHFYNDSGIKIGTSLTLTTLNNVWTLLSNTQFVIPQTRMIQVELKGTKNAGSDNDCYFDDLYLTLGEEITECEETQIETDPDPDPEPQPSSISVLALARPLQLIPNPLSTESYIDLQAIEQSNIRLHVVDNIGSKINCSSKLIDGKLWVYKNDIAPGIYHYWVKKGDYLIGKGNFSVEK